MLLSFNAAISAYLNSSIPSITGVISVGMSHSDKRLPVCRGLRYFAAVMDESMIVDHDREEPL